MRYEFDAAVNELCSANSKLDEEIKNLSKTIILEINSAHNCTLRIDYWPERRPDSTSKQEFLKEVLLGKDNVARIEFN